MDGWLWNLAEGMPLWVAHVVIVLGMAGGLLSAGGLVVMLYHHAFGEWPWEFEERVRRNGGRATTTALGWREGAEQRFQSADARNGERRGSRKDDPLRRRRG